MPEDVVRKYLTYDIWQDVLRKLAVKYGFFPPKSTKKAIKDCTVPDSPDAGTSLFLVCLNRIYIYIYRYIDR